MVVGGASQLDAEDGPAAHFCGGGHQHAGVHVIVHQVGDVLHGGSRADGLEVDLRNHRGPVLYGDGDDAAVLPQRVGAVVRSPFDKGVVDAEFSQADVCHAGSPQPDFVEFDTGRHLDAETCLLGLLVSDKPYAYGIAFVNDPFVVQARVNLLSVVVQQNPVEVQYVGIEEGGGVLYDETRAEVKRMLENADKTELLKSAYSDYFNKRIDDLFSPKLAIAVWEVNTTNNNYSIHSSVYYDKQTITENLNKFSAEQLLDKLANLNIK